MSAARPNILFIMTDQQRFDSLGCTGGIAATPNLDRLAASGVRCDNAYSPCPVCVPARYTIMSGCDSPQTGWFSNTSAARDVEQRCGGYLARTLSQRGYRTWGIGKFHTKPWGEDLGFEKILHGEENHWTEEAFERDDYVKWLHETHPEFSHLEQVHGERTDMYYTPQTRAQPTHATAESWVTDRTIEELGSDDDRPFFGFVSFVQPHPPIAPPIPYNRMFNPDDMPNPVKASADIDQADPYPLWMNYLIWADDVSDAQARQIRARYHAEIAFLDACIGRILDGLRKRPDYENTLVVFYSDHGEMLGDHRSWQKESYFEASCRVPFLVSWPKRMASGQHFDSPVSLTDLYPLATAASGECILRDGHDLLGALAGTAPPRRQLVGMHEKPGSVSFKAMIRRGPLKYIWIANGGRELLLNPNEDPHERKLWNDESPEVMAALRNSLIEHLKARGVTEALDDKGGLRSFPRTIPENERILQFERGVTGYSHAPLA
jgi:arylsulfatase